MSFDVHFLRFWDGHSAEGDLSAVQAILNTVEHTAADEFGYIGVTLDDGLEFELYLGTTARSAMFALRGISQAAVEFMFEFGKAGGYVVLLRGDELQV